MRFEDIRRQFKNEFVLIEVTKTDTDNIEILEGNILAHSAKRNEIMELLGRGLAADVAVEWCGEPDDSRTECWASMSFDPVGPQSISSSVPLSSHSSPLRFSSQY